MKYNAKHHADAPSQVPAYATFVHASNAGPAYANSVSAEDHDHFICMFTVQAYAERAKKVNEDKEKEEARREAERLRFRFFLI